MWYYKELCFGAIFRVLVSIKEFLSSDSFIGVEIGVTPIGVLALKLGHESREIPSGRWWGREKLVLQIPIILRKIKNCAK